MTHIRLQRTLVFKNRSQMNNGSNILVCMLFTGTFSSFDFFRLSDTLCHHNWRKIFQDVTTTPTLRWGCSVAVLEPFKTVMYSMSSRQQGKRLQKKLYTHNAELNYLGSCLSLDFNGICQIHQSRCRTSTARKSKDGCDNSDSMTLK